MDIRIKVDWIVVDFPLEIFQCSRFPQLILRADCKVWPTWNKNGNIAKGKRSEGKLQLAFLSDHSWPNQDTVLGGKEPRIKIEAGCRNDDSKLIIDAATNKAVASCWCKRQASPCFVAHLRHGHLKQQQQKHQPAEYPNNDSGKAVEWF